MTTKLEQRYAIIMATLPRVLPGQLSETMRVALDYADRASVNKLVRALRAAGYDLTAWEEMAKRGHSDSPAVKQAIARALEARKASAKAKAASESALEASLAPEGYDPVSLSAKFVLNSSYTTAMNFMATYCGHKLKEDGSTVLHLRIDGENYDAALRVGNEAERREMLQRLPNDVRSRVNCEGTVLRDWRTLKVLQYSITHIAPAKDSRTALVDLISAMQPWVAAEFVHEGLSQGEDDEDSV